MDPSLIQSIIEAVARGELSPEDATQQLKHLPYGDIGYAKIDHHRALRRGVPETIFGSGKTAEQISGIIAHMKESGTNILATRIESDVAQSIIKDHPDLTYNETARCLTLTLHQPEILDGYIAVVCAGTSDLPVAEEAAVTCEMQGCKVERIHDVGVAGLHRVLNQRDTLTRANALIVCAGMEGALPTVVAGLVDKPVIAVPTSIGYGASFEGIAALLGMLNSCAEGVSVVNIDNGFGAGINAALINRLANRKTT